MIVISVPSLYIPPSPEIVPPFPEDKSSVNSGIGINWKLAISAMFEFTSKVISLEVSLLPGQPINSYP